MIIMIWTQVGYSMVLLSAAIKSVPEDTVEAGRIDGAGERRIFFSIIVPQIWPTVVTVFITVLIGVMKVFDIVYVATNGAFGTDVIGRRFYDEMFTQGNNGYASAIVVILMIAIIPILIYQVRHFRAEEANR
jgi:alpha-glucoside transport system permease protein